ncbi:hypothetical protein MMC28_006956 [Mycoblastus sanguinarius]|nr:hypothetical protein [Mycoblastus sanguinarius]
MASLHASVRQLNGKVAVMDLRNPEQLQTIKKWLLENPGFVILTKATDVRAAWVGSVQDECSHDYVRAILGAIHPFGEYLIAHYECCYIGPEEKQIGQIEYREKNKDTILGIGADHLGGKRTQYWSMEADRGGLGEVTKNMGIIDLHGQDIFIFNTRFHHSSPQPVIPPQHSLNLIRIGYVWTAREHKD